jgi:hypothetical protein
MSPTRILTQSLHSHLRMKNEQFGYPLTEERLDEIDNGKIEPLEEWISLRLRAVGRTWLLMPCKYCRQVPL